MMNIPLARTKLAEHINATGQIKVSITVPLTNGQTLAGTDVIRIKSL